MFVDVDNVTSNQICIMRRELRKIDAQMVMGKNTHMKAAITNLMEEPDKNDEDYEARKARYAPRPHLALVMRQLVGNVGMVFTNGDMSAIKEILDTQSREAPAKPGSLAPADVTVQPGPTGLDPKQTAFFQALQIQTKIVKAQIEIINPVTVIKKDEKVTQSQAALLEKLGIRPFEYKMHVLRLIENGKLYPAAILSIKSENILAAFGNASDNMTCLSLSTGYTTAPAARHLILNAFKNLACVSFATDYSFP
jgi:large subunit ribosomal protein LP0